MRLRRYRSKSLGSLNHCQLIRRSTRHVVKMRENLAIEFRRRKTRQSHRWSTQRCFRSEKAFETLGQPEEGMRDPKRTQHRRKRRNERKR